MPCTEMTSRHSHDKFDRVNGLQRELEHAHHRRLTRHARTGRGLFSLRVLLLQERPFFSVIIQRLLLP
jgi:hypothetical protein